MGENLLLSDDLRKLRKLRALCAVVSGVAVIGFAFYLYILITGYHSANRVSQIAWLLANALMACAYFSWFRSYSAQVKAVTRSMNRTAPKPH
ncbi:MAG: hypothetical protein WAL45_16320 [Terracidiphilus sp.]